MSPSPPSRAIDSASRDAGAALSDEARGAFVKTSSDVGTWNRGVSNGDRRWLPKLDLGRGGTRRAAHRHYMGGNLVALESARCAICARGPHFSGLKVDAEGGKVLPWEA